MRDELAVTAKDAATRAREVASTGAREVAARARDAAATAGEWVPIFQRPEDEGELNGETIAEPIVDSDRDPGGHSGRQPPASEPRSRPLVDEVE